MFEPLERRLCFSASPSSTFSSLDTQESILIASFSSWKAQEVSVARQIGSIVHGTSDSGVNPTSLSNFSHDASTRFLKLRTDIVLGDQKINMGVSKLMVGIRIAARKPANSKLASNVSLARTHLNSVAAAVSQAINTDAANCLTGITSDLNSIVTSVSNSSGLKNVISSDNLSLDFKEQILITRSSSLLTLIQSINN